ncbi:MAG: oxidoreductase [Rhizobiaceae bacterium MnEN-MB40S]|nr:MAG: oxidoreductase [Rhizobiaceae bacterium MnEN-MB40S]
MSCAPVSFSLNGVERTLDVAAETRLSEILRDLLSLTASKVACGVGRCGACTVLMNGKPVNACLVMAWQIEGADIVSPEGLDILPETRIVRQAMTEENAFQCGYCAPGFVTVLVSLLHNEPEADLSRIKATLEGNICRCTGYHSIVRGAQAAAEAVRAERSKVS